MTFSSIAIEVGRASTAQTHPITIRESMGFQWALSFATHAIDISESPIVSHSE